MNTIDLPAATVELDDKGVVWTRFKDLQTLDRISAVHYAHALIRLCRDVPRLFMIDSRDIHGNITPEARSYLANHPILTRLRVGQAFLVNNLANRIIANGFIRINKPANPTQVFSSVQKAAQWLESLPQ